VNTVYRITCTANGKFYIGSTVNKKQRWYRHRRQLRAGTHPNRNMLASWVKYGEASFVFEVLEELPQATDLFAAEQRYLDAHAGKDCCFNWANYAGAPMRGKRGAETPNFGKAVPEHVRAKISAGLSGEKHPNWGKVLSAETREKIRETNKSHPMKGRKHTPEAIAKIAAAGRGRPVSDETRAKRSAALKGREIPLEQRLRISKTLTGPGNFWYGKKRPDSFAAKIRKALVATAPDGQEHFFDSIQSTCAALSLLPPTIHRALKSDRPLARGSCAGWAFRYAAQPVKPT